jgi:STE24 endopeptidase
MFLLLFGVLFLQKLVKLGLLMLNANYLRQHGLQVPAKFQTVISSTTAQKATQYTLENSRVGVYEIAYETIMLLAVIFSGALGILDTWVASVVTQGLWIIPVTYLQGLLYVLTFFIAITILSIPIDLYKTFSIDQRYELNNMTFKLWLMDFFKGILLITVMTTLLLLPLFLVMDLFGAYWWIAGSLLVVAYQYVSYVLGPALIYPLFHKFTPIADGELKDAIRQLCNKLNYSLQGIYTVDGSTRSNRVNAFFSGIGKFKRVVLYDTLIAKLSKEQTLAVLAHEVGHKKHNHIVKFFLLGTAGKVISLWVLSLLLNYLPMYQAFGVASPSYHAGLIIFMVLSGPILYFTKPLVSFYMRKCEYEADNYALRAMGSSEPLTTALVATVTSNLNPVTPHPFYSAFYYSHPTLAERVAAMEQAEKGIICE